MLLLLLLSVCCCCFDGDAAADDDDSFMPACSVMLAMLCSSSPMRALISSMRPRMLWLKVVKRFCWVFGKVRADEGA